MQELIEGVDPGTGASTSDSSWSNAEIFQKYFDFYCLKFSIPGGPLWCFMMAPLPTPVRNSFYGLRQKTLFYLC
jgi:hypothetical protein